MQQAQKKMLLTLCKSNDWILIIPKSLIANSTATWLIISSFNPDARSGVEPDQTPHQALHPGAFTQLLLPPEAGPGYGAAHRASQKTVSDQ